MEKIRLGKSEIYVSPVGMGTLTMGFSQKNLSIKEGGKIIEAALNGGINFLDTAQYYDTYRFIRPVLDKLKESGKTLPIISSKTLAPDYEGAKKDLLACLCELNVTCIDIFLLHEVRGIKDWNERQGAWQALKDLKKAGYIKAIGISSHHVDACLTMSKEKDCDVIFALINKVGMGIRNGDKAGSRGEMEAAIKACAEKDIGVFTMKAFAGGNIVSDYRACLDYSSNILGSSSTMIGMGSCKEVSMAIDYFENRLPNDYKPDTSNKIMKVDQSDCEGCGSCLARCSCQAISWNENGLAEIDTNKCVHCGYCAPVCPVRAIIFIDGKK